MEDIRSTWFEKLSKEEAVEANNCLGAIFETCAIAGGLTFSELIQVQKSQQRFYELTGRKASEVLDSFVEYGYCYGNEYLPESYFGE